MTTLVPRPPYTDDELRSLYPAGLELQLVQILMRHGERTPVRARFQNAGLAAYWPYCSAARQLQSVALDRSTGQFTPLEWKRRMETFGPNDEPVLAKGPRGELDGICEMGMLTDRGRVTTYDLGSRLRRLYVDQLGFLPPNISDADSLYLRATPIPRALESMQEAFSGLYPRHTRSPDMAPPSILTRNIADETLFPNDSSCRRFAALARAFANRAAERHNDSDEMAYLTKIYGKWMSSDKVAVDSHPRLNGLMDTVNSTLAHGPETKLPKAFYDAKAIGIMEKISNEEWFQGYKESQEYRALGIGGLLGDVVSRMVGSAERSTADGAYEVAQALDDKRIHEGKGATPIRFGLSGCHDTTLAAVLSSLGAFETDRWPPYTSHIAIEMFRQKQQQQTKNQDSAPTTLPAIPPAKDTTVVSKPGFLSSLFSWGGSAAAKVVPGTPPPGIGRKKTETLTDNEKKELEGYYVRLRYNDQVVTIPGCKAPGKHFAGDESFCTLAEFKAIVDKFTPDNWKSQCLANIDAPAFPAKPEPAGYSS
ncbi:histidine acid phosphatase [Microdochium trichocladiopsis]|uniref:3-phytase n=1 Tax=Microdochium trichocladiopsis TaxID=1682393 RepID=A0A9P8YGI6_9PEZI|nr:histidine acid phosphatase [Microdochium trichocladiopsis]KAH7037680.1 histidine acid phosphatase [Microdochium trichocladiopsis]